MDIYYEKNVINQKILQDDSRVKRFKTLRIVSCVAIALGVLAGLYWLRWSDITIVFNILILACFIGPAIAGILLCTRALKQINCEYDYVLSGTDFRIIQIYDQNKRVKLVETDVVNFLQIGFTNSAEFDKIKQMPKVKRVTAFCNDCDRYLYVYCTISGEKSIILCEYDDEFITVLRKYVPSYGVFCDEIRRMKV